MGTDLRATRDKIVIILVSVSVILCRPLIVTYHLANFLQKFFLETFLCAVMKNPSKIWPY